MPTPTSDDANNAYGRESGDHTSLATAAVKGKHRANETRPPGDYSDALTRWAEASGNPQPPATEPGVNNRPRLSARFVEWLMGLPPGHITDLPIPRTRQIHLCGNGVVPQQARLALQHLDPQPGQPQPATSPEPDLLLPTPTTQDANNNNGPAQQRRDTKPLNVVAHQLPPHGTHQ